MPSFSWQEQQQLATLIRSHRRKFPLEVFEAMPLVSRTAVQRLCVLLRLAVLLHRARHDIELRGLRLLAGKHTLGVRFARGWLRQHPLTHADLEQEAVWLKAAGFRLDFG